jgi:hypothetical protein
MGVQRADGARSREARCCGQGEGKERAGREEGGSTSGGGAQGVQGQYWQEGKEGWQPTKQEDRVSFMPSILSGLKLPGPPCQSPGGSSLEDKETRSTSEKKDQETVRTYYRRSAEWPGDSDPDRHMVDSSRIEAAQAICTSEMHISPYSQSQQICQREMTYVGCNLPLCFVCFQGTWLAFVLDFANMNGILVTLTSHLFDLRTHVTNKENTLSCAAARQSPRDIPFQY